MRLKIVSGGNTANTRVENADTGEMVDGVVGVKWECSVGPDGEATLATAVLTFELVECDVVGEGLVATVESTA